MSAFSFARFVAMLRKELLQMRRDRATIGLTVALPLIQLFVFGFAINTNPRHLPTAVLSADHSQYERSFVTALNNTGYFDLRAYGSEKDVDRALDRGDVLFALHVPPGFGRSVDRGEQPNLLIEADATDSMRSAARQRLFLNRARGDFARPAAKPAQPAKCAGLGVTVHNRYNPEQITALNIVPGLIGVILSFSTLVATTLSITRERETGTMENLLAMPARPVEVMLGKIVPYVGLGYIQVFLILFVAVIVFHVPVLGSLPLLLFALGVFIACNLAIGFTLSSIATTQMQAQQMAQFILLPSLLLSGFLFPFAGMPPWARFIGEALPLTHIVRICRGVLLKGNGWPEILPNLWPMILFALVLGAVAVRSYRQTLD